MCMVYIDGLVVLLGVVLLGYRLIFRMQAASRAASRQFDMAVSFAIVTTFCSCGGEISFPLLFSFPEIAASLGC